MSNTILKRTILWFSILFSFVVLRIMGLVPIPFPSTANPESPTWQILMTGISIITFSLVWILCITFLQSIQENKKLSLIGLIAIVPACLIFNMIYPAIYGVRFSPVVYLNGILPVMGIWTLLVLIMNYVSKNQKSFALILGFCLPVGFCLNYASTLTGHGPVEFIFYIVLTMPLVALTLGAESGLNPDKKRSFKIESYFVLGSALSSILLPALFHYTVEEVLYSLGTGLVAAIAYFVIRLIGQGFGFVGGKIIQSLNQTNTPDLQEQTS